MTTDFGKELRKIRIDRDENLALMAKKLGISISYLSAIEIGTRNVPEDFIDKLVEKYHLSKSATDSLLTAKDRSINQVEVSLSRTTDSQRNLAIALSRKIKEISDEDCEKMLEMIKEK